MRTDLSFLRSAFIVMVALLVVSLTSLTAEDDAHFIQQDDYFIAGKAMGGNTWIRVDLAKMITPPDIKTKNEGKFMQIGDGKEVWTKYFWKTRVAVPADIKIGTLVIVLDIAGDESIYRAPENYEEAKTTAWFMAKITDISDLYKGYVMVSGGYKVNPKAIRVILK